MLIRRSYYFDIKKRDTPWIFSGSMIDLHLSLHRNNILEDRISCDFLMFLKD